MCQAFFDVRMFGAVMTTGKALCGRVQGPVQLGFSRSARPVLAQEHGLTRITHTGQEDIDKGESSEMGSKHAIPYGLYLGNGRWLTATPGTAGRTPHRRPARKPWRLPGIGRASADADPGRRRSVQSWRRRQPSARPPPVEGNRVTGWHTGWYTSSRCGNLYPGTGLLLDMGRAVTITSVRINLGRVVKAPVSSCVPVPGPH